MKKIKMGPVGCNKDEYREYLAFELIEHIASLMLAIKASCSFPSLPALNELFSREKIDEGMSGGVSWIAFEVSESERTEMKKITENKYGFKFEYNESLESIKSYDNWFESALSKKRL